MNPVMYNGMPVTDMAQLSALMGAPYQPQPYVQPPTVAGYPAPAYVTADQVRAIVGEQLKSLNAAPSPDLARLQTVFNQVGDLAKRALKEDDYKALQAYITGGAPGFANMLTGDALYPIMELLWDTIKENNK